MRKLAKLAKLVEEGTGATAVALGDTPNPALAVQGTSPESRRKLRWKKIVKGGKPVKEERAPNPPEAPQHWSNTEAAAWQSGWSAGWEDSNSLHTEPPEAPDNWSNTEAAAWQSGWEDGHEMRYQYEL